VEHAQLFESVPTCEEGYVEVKGSSKCTVCRIEVSCAASLSLVQRNPRYTYGVFGRSRLFLLGVSPYTLDIANMIAHLPRGIVVKKHLIAQPLEIVVVCQATDNYRSCPL